MYFDIEQLDGRRSYKLLTATIVPRPIAWVVTIDADGVTNAAPFSFFNFFSGTPPVICIGIGRRDGGASGKRDKDTLANIRGCGQFVVNLVSAEMVEAMNVTAVDFPTGHDELAHAGLASAASTRVRPPRIAASPVALECTFRDALEVDTTGHIVIGHVTGVHVRDDAVVNAEKCYIDTAKLDLIGRMESPGWYTHTRERFKLAQMDFGQWQARQPSPTD